jgi:hypothetical protein
MTSQISIARPIAPEDLRPGRYVVVLSVVREHIALNVTGDACSSNVDMRYTGPIRLSWMVPAQAPMRVKSVCLPIVFVRRHDGSHALLDARLHRLARVPKPIARQMIACLAADRKADRTGASASLYDLYC